MLFVPEEYWRLGILLVDILHISFDSVAAIINLSIAVIFSLRNGNKIEKLCGHFVWLPKSLAVVIIPS